MEFEEFEEFDLTVDSVEVTQATQTLTNSIPLVARKSTAVRATIRRPAAAPSIKVSGRLHVSVDGVEVASIAPIAPLTLAGAPSRNNENHTLNFELRAPTAIRASSDVDFRVDIFTVSVIPNIPETDTTNNSGSADDLTAVERCTPWFYFTRVDYTPSGLGFPLFDTVKPGRGDAFLRGILPADDSDPALYRETTPVTYSDDPNGNGILDGFEQLAIAGFLESQRQLIVRDWVGANDRVFLYGWIAGNPIDGNGSVGPRVGFGNTEGIRYQRTFVHEYLHSLGLTHPDNYVPSRPLGLDEVGWDVGARLVQNPAGNNETSRVKRVVNTVTGPDFDVMTANKFTNEAWINTSNYWFLLNHPRLVSNCRPVYPKPRLAVVTGIAEIAGIATRVKVRQVFRYPWESEPTHDDDGRFVAEVTDTNGVTTGRRFDSTAGEASDNRADGTFSVMLPVDPNAEIASLRILDAEQREQVAELERTEPPSITIVSPQRGDALGDQTNVQWAVDDPDTPDSELLFQAAYSHDNGRSWNPIGVDIAGNERGFIFDASQVPESAGEGIIRVFVSDGLNTAYADVAGLTR